MADNGMLEVQVERREGTVVIAPHGAVDLQTAPVLESVLQTVTGTPQAPVVVDLSGLDLLDCRGIGALATARAALSEAGLPLVLTGARRGVRRILRLFEDVDRPATASDPLVRSAAVAGAAATRTNS